MARGVPAAGIRADAPRRAIRIAVRGSLGSDHDVGNSRARHHQRTTRAGGDARHEPVRSRRALCARQGQALEQGRTPARPRGRRPAARLRLRHAPPPRISLAALVRRGAAGRARRQFHRHVQHQARDGHRPRGDRHQRPRIADGLRRARRERFGAARRALRGVARLGADVWRQSLGGSARLLRHHGVSRTGARLGRGLEGRAPGFEGARRRGARVDRLVEAPRARSPRQTDGALRRDGH